MSPVLYEASPRDLLIREMGIVPGDAVLNVGTDAEELAFEDAAFDHVVSVFGVQFAPRHEVVAAELLRVCRPGGKIGLVSWTPEGQVGELLAIVRRYLPLPPDFASPPQLWGSQDHVRHLFGDAVELTFTRGLHPLQFGSREAYIESLETGYLTEARERLQARGRWQQCRNEILAMVERRNEATDGSLRMYAEYFAIVGRVRLRPAMAAPAVPTSPRPGARPGR
jgi:SAM-dependent methyltransferase